MTTIVYLLSDDTDCAPMHDMVEVTPEIVRLKSGSAVAAIYCVTEARLHVAASLAVLQDKPELAVALPSGVLDSLEFLTRELDGLMESGRITPEDEITLSHEDAALVFCCFGLCAAMGDGHKTAELMLAALEHVTMHGEEEVADFMEVMSNLETTVFSFLSGKGDDAETGDAPA